MKDEVHHSTHPPREGGLQLRARRAVLAACLSQNLAEWWTRVAVVLRIGIGSTRLGNRMTCSHRHCWLSPRRSISLAANNPHRMLVRRLQRPGDRLSAGPEGGWDLLQSHLGFTPDRHPWQPRTARQRNAGRSRTSTAGKFRAGASFSSRCYRIGEVHFSRRLDSPPLAPLEEFGEQVLHDLGLVLKDPVARVVDELDPRFGQVLVGFVK